MSLSSQGCAATAGETGEIPAASDLIPIGLLDDGSTVDLSVTDGGFWAVYETEPFVRLFSHEGSRLVAAFGRFGKGPGELIAPRAVTHWPSQVDGEGIALLDVSDGGIKTYDVTGVHRSTFGTSLLRRSRIRNEIGDLTYGRPFQLRTAERGFVFATYPDGLDVPSDMRRGRIHWVDFVTGAHSVVVDFGEVVDRESDSPLVPRIPLWDVCGDEIVMLDQDHGELRFIGIEGDHRRTVAVRRKERPLRRAEGRNAIARVMAVESGGEVDPRHRSRRIDHAYRKYKHLLPASAPLAADLRCGFDGSVWAEVFDASAHPLGHSGAWVDLSGKTNERLALPPNFRPREFLATRVIGLEEAIPGYWRASDARVLTPR